MRNLFETLYKINVKDKMSILLFISLRDTQYKFRHGNKVIVGVSLPYIIIHLCEGAYMYCYVRRRKTSYNNALFFFFLCKVQ